MAGSSGAGGGEELARLEQHAGDVFVLHMTTRENRLNPAFFARVHALLDQVVEHDGPTALVIAAEGKVWSNGLDLQWLGANRDQVVPFLCEFMRFMGRLLVLPVPTVAAISGHAFAGGMILAMVNDFRVMRTGRGFLCMPEIDLHMPMAPGMIAAVTCKVGDVNTVRDLLLRGKRMAAEEALARGLIDAAVAQDELLSTALELAGSVAAKGADKDTYGKMKRTVFADAYSKLMSNDLALAAPGAKL
eukprot:TRINITY_DN7463_c0_g1_i1.p2 TRINITY_DN7463_c0_g1~~TRINITY_DN7463_c0_g1_i1.p2  ORF type:complete len:258 (+),score=89.29 TRINITY_DN7463_c0_g1_i1:39-776(+)